MSEIVEQAKTKIMTTDIVKMVVIFLLRCVVRKDQYYTKASRYPCDPYFKVTVLYALYFVPFFYWRAEDFDDD